MQYGTKKLVKCLVKSEDEMCRFFCYALLNNYTTLTSVGRVNDADC